MKFPLKGPVKPQKVFLGQSSQKIKNATEYIYDFVALSTHHNPENHLQ